MSRSIYAQMSYAIHGHMRIGVSKRSDKLNGVNTHKYFYSLKTFRNTKEQVRTFSKYMKEIHPKVRLVKDITPEHVEGFMRSRPEMTPSTVTTYATFFRKIDDVLNDTYHCSLDFDGIDFKHLLPPKSGGDVPETPPMTMEDFQELHKYMITSKTNAAFVPFMAYSIGARVEEITLLRSEEIDVEKKVVHLNHCKNGRKRTVPIRNQYLPSWRNLKQYCEENDWQTVVGGIARDSVSDALRRAKHAVGIQEKYPHQGCHAIRKLFANTRLEEELDKGKDLESAWVAVQQELGHGPESRERLFRTYIGMPMKKYAETYLNN